MQNAPGFQRDPNDYTVASPFDRGTGDWNGVVTIVRPQWATDADMCKVMSARTLEYNGKRAIVCDVPFGLVRRYFDVFDGEEVYAFAEFKNALGGGHLEFYEKASQMEWFLTAGGERNMYPAGTRQKVY